MKKFILSLALLGFFASGLVGQNNEAERVRDNIPVAGGEKTDVIFTRSFLPGDAGTGVFLDGARSGASSLGIGLGIPIGKAFEFKFEPRLTWLKLYYNPTSDSTKSFPSTITSNALVYEKQRAFYLEIPVGFRLKLARNSRDNYKFMFEGGFNFGINTGSSAKTRIDVDQDGDGDFDTFATTKVHRVENLELLRYGPYGRIGTNWIQIYAFYRLSDVFQADETFNNGVANINYPTFPALEIGLSLSL